MNLPEILSALAHERPGEQAHARMAPSPKIIPGIEGIHHRPPIPSAVMVLLSPENNDWNLLLIRRSNQGKYHGGQIAFPGGKIEESDPDKQSAALRECQEEIGVSPQHINIVSTLSDIYIPLSNFNITPSKTLYMFYTQNIHLVYLLPHMVHALKVQVLHNLLHLHLY